MARKLAWTCILITVFSLNAACQPISGAAVATATPQPTRTEAPLPTVAPSPTTNFAATDAARASAQSTQEAVAQAAAETRVVEQALEETAVVEAAATQQASNMYALVQELKDEGYLDRTEGTYYAIEDFEESWAQINWYQWWLTGLEPANFVLRAHTEWESASRTANWFSSGCGFVFREEDEKNHYVIFLALDGNVYLSRMVDGLFMPIGHDYYGQIDYMQGSADVMLVAVGSHIQYFVNGERILDRNNATFDQGALGLTLLSGTNKDYGTRCKISGLEVWELGD